MLGSFDYEVLIGFELVVPDCFLRGHRRRSPHAVLRRSVLKCLFYLMFEIEELTYFSVGVIIFKL